MLKVQNWVKAKGAAPSKYDNETISAKHLSLWTFVTADLLRMVVFVLKWRRNWERSSPSFYVCRYWSPCRQRRRRRRHYWPTFGPGRRGGGEKGPGGKYDSIAQDSSVGGNWELGGAADLVKLSIFEQKVAKRSSSPSKEIAADLFTSRSHCQLFLSLSRTFPSWGFLNPIRSNWASDTGIG